MSENHPTLASELIEASRTAASYREAIAAALEALRCRMGAQSAMLLESSDEEFRTTSAVKSSVCSLPRRGLLLNRLKFYDGPLPISGEDLDTWHRWATGQEPRHVPEIETLRRAGVRLAATLRTNQEVFGMLLLGAPVRGGRYAISEERMLRGCADQFALLLENAHLTDRLLDQEKLRRDVVLAAEVQQRLLARRSLENGQMSLAAVSIPARSVGGDFYDLLELEGGRTGIALADVAGKGVPAALIMSGVQATLRVLSAEPAISPSELAAKMNHFLYQSTASNHYATFFYAHMDRADRDRRDRRLHYVNAGHNSPYVLRSGGQLVPLEELSVGGTVIGMFPKVRYEEGVVDLRPGDLLMAFTDGVPEALNPHDEEFGEERLQRLLRRVSSLPLNEMISQISQELKNWIQDAAQYDDLTFVLMKMK